MGEAAIRIREAAVGYAGRTVLRDIDLTIRPGERVALLGRSGAGKSTLLNLVYAARRGPRRAGAAGRRPGADAERLPQRLHGPARPPFRLVQPAQPRVARRAEVEAVRAVLREVGLEPEIFRRAGELSGGQQQRVSVARALYNGRPIAVGDEPVSALDAVQGAAVLGRLAARHETLVLALHDVRLALAHATRILALDGGRIALDAPAAGSGRPTSRASTAG